MFFVPLNYMNPKRFPASKVHMNPSNFVIVIRDLFLLQHDQKLKVNRDRSVDSTALY